ncbi:Myosin-like protein, partial [Globisporangium splendens]
MKLFSLGSKKSAEEKAREQALKEQQKTEKARLKELKKQAKEQDAIAKKAAKDEKKRVKREEKEWRKHEKVLRDREAQAHKAVEKREKEERKRVKKLERQHATTKRREERRRRKEFIRNRRKMKKLRKQLKKQRRAEDAAAQQQQLDELLAAEAARSPQPQDPEGGAMMTAPIAATVAPEFKKRQNCFTCRARFNVTRRRHHCRNCGESCCKKCVSQAKHEIPWQGKNKPQKVCVMCDTLVFSDRTAASLVVDGATATSEGTTAAVSTRAPSRSNSLEVAVDAAVAPRPASSGSSSRPASGSGISVSLSSRSGRLARRTDSGSSSSPTLTKKPSLWTLPIRPLLKRKRSADRLRNRQLDFELQLEKADMLARQGLKSRAIELQPQHSMMTPVAPVS